MSTTININKSKRAKPLDDKDDMSKLLNQKANIDDLKILNDMKSNKVDVEQNMQCVDILHK